jgi:hypothetical protein
MQSGSGSRKYTGYASLRDASKQTNKHVPSREDTSTFSVIPKQNALFRNDALGNKARHAVNWAENVGRWTADVSVAESILYNF